MDLDAIKFADLSNSEFRWCGRFPISPIGFMLALMLLEQAGLDHVHIEIMRCDEGKEVTKKFIAGLTALRSGYMRRVVVREGGEVPPRPTGWGTMADLLAWEDQYGEKPSTRTRVRAPTSEEVPFETQLRARQLGGQIHIREEPDST